MNNGARLFLEHALLYVKRRPRLKAYLFQLLQMLPSIRRKAFLFAENRKYSSSKCSPSLPEIFTIPDPELVSIWLNVSSKYTIRRRQ
ncbi:hypothetical protein CU102_23100 [Phyllobacterium brassicacearum]|uniref:Uncharacterized protein n=1 Tax=Phyllobacterium brassicacearum TaxID=314235 RepID=A0A2P7BBB1_9HYPH|nr:hypothetical protein CU102_23100 [Phyllobacterium brassicacearum]